jgi:hypothetical protein
MKKVWTWLNTEKAIVIIDYNGFCFQIKIGHLVKPLL